MSGVNILLVLGLALTCFPSAFALPITAQTQRQMLCQPNEKLIFGTLTAGGKMVCLCGSSNLTAERGYLQYRFGRPDWVELEYPVERTGSQPHFYYAHDHRYQPDSAAVRFRNKTTSFITAPRVNLGGRKLNTDSASLAAHIAAQATKAQTLSYGEIRLWESSGARGDHSL
ncbi:MAG: hypothetical protein ACUVR8_08360 [Acidobacteriota bacterium]